MLDCFGERGEIHGRNLDPTTSLLSLMKTLYLAVFFLLTCSLTIKAQFSSPPSTGLVSWWRADGNANDSFGANNGALFNGAGYGTGVFGSSFSFDGSNDHVRVPDNLSLRFNTAITVGAWIYPTSHGAYHNILGKWDAVFGISQHSFSIALEPNGRGYMVLSPSGTQAGAATVLTANTVPLNTWSHLAATYDGSSIRIFFNGVLTGELAYGNGFLSSTDDLAIGGFVGGGSPGQVVSPFAGRIDEAVLYNRSLTAAEVMTLATIPEPSSVALVAGAVVVLCLRRNPHRRQAGLEEVPARIKNGSLLAKNFLSIPALSSVFWIAIASTITAQAQYSLPSSGLVSWWQAEGNANDSVDGNNGAALNGSSYATGVFGSAFSFDGANDHIRVASSANLQITSALTIGAWVNRQSLGTYDEVISKWDAIPIGQRSYTLGMHPDGRAYLNLSTDGSDFGISVLTPSAVALGSWVHLAGTYDGAFARIYVNGALAAQAVYAGGIFSGSDDFSIGGVVGGVGVHSGISFFHGRIDEAVIYNRALSGPEVLALATIPEPSSVAVMFTGFACILVRQSRRMTRGNH